MLVLSRKKGESLIIDNHVTVTILDVQQDKIKMGISAPKNVTILRKELYDKVSLENIEASKASGVSLKEVSLIETALKQKEDNNL